MYMFSSISGVSLEDSRQIILNTATGKAIEESSAVVLYEQQTDNLYSIAQELHAQKEYRDMSRLFTVEAIRDSMRNLRSLESCMPGQGDLRYRINGSVDLKAAAKKKNEEAMKRTLKQKRQNCLNERRIKHVDKTEG